MTTINLDLGSLPGVDGTKINGFNATGQLGVSVSSIGDINGDGFEDIILGAPLTDVGATDSGRAFVMLGREPGFGASFDLFNLGLAAEFGFRLENQVDYAHTAQSVSGGGDINGDGLADLIIGAPNYAVDPNDGSGDAFIVFGQPGVAPFGVAFDLTTLDGADGSFIAGTGDPYERVGSSVSIVGDINGDGVDDFIVGAHQEYDGVYQTGAAFVVFGNPGGLGGVFDLTALDGFNGFKLIGVDPGDEAGFSVSGGGDFNGDGLADLLVSAPRGDAQGVDAGEVYVVFGSSAPGAAQQSLDTLNGADGFRIDGVNNGYGGVLAGYSVSNAGDVNGDGFDDIIVGVFNDTPYGSYETRYAGRSLVIFGGDAGFGASISADDLDGSNGFIINGGDSFDGSGRSVAAAGDVNGDGFDDVLIGATGVNGGAGESFIVFGAETFNANFDLSDLLALDATSGVRFTGGVSPGDNLGASVSSAGDFNGDGLDDILLGAPINRVTYGSVFLVRGADFDNTIDFLGDNADDVVNGTAAAESFVGGLGDDTVFGNGGADAFSGGGGDDFAEVTDTTFRQVDGGTGEDTLRLNGAGLTIDFTANGDQNVRDVEAIELVGGSTVTLDTLSVLGMSTTTNVLKVSSDGLGDIVLTDAGAWTVDEASSAGVTLTNGLAALTVDENLPFLAAFDLPLLSVFDLSGLDGADGFVIEGGDDDEMFAIVGRAGDVNGDGFEDFIVGAPGSNYIGSGSGALGGAAVVFGGLGPFPELASVSDLDSAEGFLLIGGDYDYAGVSVSGLGDVNGDGFADIIIGGNGGPGAYGRSYVVFGTDTPVAAPIDLTGLDGADGFRIDGFSSFDQTGYAVGEAGDFNGDGFNDIIVGGLQYDPTGRINAGGSFIVFGTDAGFAASIAAQALNGTDGVKLIGAQSNDLSGFSVNGAGDLNGDGLSDVAIGARSSDQVSVVFGTDALVGDTIDLAALDGSNGFTLLNAEFYTQVSSAGDINGDGFDDLIVGAHQAANSGYQSGSVFVVFGSGAAFAATIDLAALDGANGFRIDGVDDFNLLGFSVSGAGDFNGDGLDDLLLGGPGLGSEVPGDSALIFGTLGGFAATINIADLDGADGFRIADVVTGDSSGGAVSVAGDINGDGFDDLLVGTPYGVNSLGAYSGQANVIFGGDTGAVTDLGGENTDNITGAATGSVIVGGAGGDSLVAVASPGFRDVLIGGSGNDFLVVQELDFLHVDGGTGIDRLGIDIDGAILDLTDLGSSRITDIELLQIQATNTVTVRLDALSILNLSSTSNTLRADVSVAGNGSTIELLDAGWTTTGLGGSFVNFQNGEAILEAEVDLPVTDPFNTAPVSIDDAFTVNENETFSGAGANVLNGNLSGGAGFADSDADGDFIFLDTTPVVGPSRGSLTLFSNGQFTYTADPGSAGVDSFVYDVTDGKGGFATGTVNIAINAVAAGPAVLDDTFTTNEDTALADDIVANDIDPNGDTVTVTTVNGEIASVGSAITLASGATLLVNADGTFSYDPRGVFDFLAVGELAQETFAYTVQDIGGADGDREGTATITVTGVNDAPFAAADSFSPLEDTVLNGDVSGNDIDPDGDVLTFSKHPTPGLGDPTNGVLLFNPDGTFTYTPNANFSGSDGFTYIVDDGNGGQFSAFVGIMVIEVPDQPVATDDEFTTGVGADVSGNLILDDNGNGVDSDGDGDALRIVSVEGSTLNVNTAITLPSGAVLTVLLNGDFTYTPDPGFLGADTFEYQITDSNGGLGGATVTINVAGGQPVPADDSFATDEDTPLAVSDPGLGLLANDVDPEDDAIFVAAVEGGAPGQSVMLASGAIVIVNADGTFSYDPNGAFDFLGAGETGSDSFTYSIVDAGGSNGLADGQVDIDIVGLNDAPTTQGTIREKAEAADAPFSIDLLDGAVDPDATAVLSVEDFRVIRGDDGGFLLNGNQIEVDPSFYDFLADGELESVRFRYNIVDGEGGVVDQRLVVNVRGGGNQGPVAADDQFVGLQGEQIIGDLLADNGFGLDSDADGDTLRVAEAASSPPTHGGVVISRNGEFIYTPDASFSGADSFIYQLQDGNGGTAFGTVDLSITRDLSNVFQSQPGDDVVNGDGQTTVEYGAGANGAIFADLGAGAINAPGFGLDRVSGVFEVRATAFNDFLFGSDGGQAGVSPSQLLPAFESFEGLQGDDLIFGGAGLDRVNYDASPSGVVVDLSASIALDDGFGGVDSLFSIEGVQGGDFADVLIGDAGDNFFEPARGADDIDGGAGVDSLIFVGLGSGVLVDLMDGRVLHENGDIAIVRNVENVEGGAGPNELRGDGEANILIGADQDDFLAGRAGADDIHGGAGDDRMFGNSADDELRGGAGKDRLNGGSGDDLLVGNTGADELLGGSGDDMMIGGGGGDIFDGGAGEDQMRGGGGEDLFVLTTGMGVDTILDFDLGADLMDVSAFGFGLFSEIDPLIFGNNAGIEIRLAGNADVVRLVGLNIGDLSDADFVFSG